MNFAPFSALLSLRTLFSALGGAVSGWGDALLAQLGISRSKPEEPLSPLEKLLKLAEDMSPFIIYGDFDEETAKALGLIEIPEFASLEEEQNWYVDLADARTAAQEAAEAAEDAEWEARWAEGEAFFVRFMDASREYMRLNWPGFRLGMRPLWRNAALAIFLKFQNGVLAESRNCALFVPGR